MKGNQQRTILYGDSLILAGARVDLSACPSVEIIILDHPLAQPVEEISALHPDAVIFDLGAIQPDFPGSLLHQPDLLLIGLDPETHQALVWSGRQEAALEARDLLEIIQNKKGAIT